MAWFKLQTQFNTQPRTFSSEIPVTEVPLSVWCRPTLVFSPPALLLAFQLILSEKGPEI